MDTPLLAAATRRMNLTNTLWASRIPKACVEHDSSYRQFKTGRWNRHGEGCRDTENSKDAPCLKGQWPEGPGSILFLGMGMVRRFSVWMLYSQF